MSATKIDVWFHRETMTLYGIPKDVLFIEGDYEIERFDGVTKSIENNKLEEYQITKKEAEELLRKSYDDAMSIANKRLQAMARFADLTGKATGENIKDFLTGNGTAPGFDAGQDMVQDFFKAINDTSATEEERQETFKNTFKKVPEIMSFFDDDALDKAAEDPDAWADEMYKKMFGEVEAKKKEQRKSKLQEEINEQIRKNVEEAMREAQKKNKDS